MSELQESIRDDVNAMMDHLSHLHDAPVLEIACIANGISAMIHAGDFAELGTLATCTRIMVQKCLERLPAKMVLCGDVAPEEG